MELKLVYRALRKLSEWTLAFYSEVNVVGQENVPLSGPLILISTHHNEIIDIATLAVTIPHRRPVCFWTKSSMFKVPIVREVLSSSGSIPVTRNPNNLMAHARSNSEGNTSSSVLESQQGLFQETFKALDASEVIGVFPEGTSYTEPSIAQVKDGAAWAALEYMRWKQQEQSSSGEPKEPLMLIPVGIVYTDKSQYQSRVLVRWGQPIPLEDLAAEYASDSGFQNPREVVKKLTARIESSLIRLTINAPDWDTLYAARAARDILWHDEVNIPLKDFVTVSQSIIDLLSDSSLAANHQNAKVALLQYYSLLHYSSISHSSLVALYPDTTVIPTVQHASFVLFKQLIKTILHPRFLFFIPPFLAHIPVYICGALGEKFLTVRDEEETKAEFKCVLGGLGFGLTSAIIGGKLASQQSWLPKPGEVAKLFQNGLSVLFGASGERLKRIITVLTVMYGTTWLLFAWHRALVAANYREFKRLVTAVKVLHGLLRSRSMKELSAEELQVYSRPPRPPRNPFLNRKQSTNSEAPHLTSENSYNPTIMAPSRKPAYIILMRQLLAARISATFFAKGLR